MLALGIKACQLLLVVADAVDDAAAAAAAAVVAPAADVSADGLYMRQEVLRSCKHMQSQQVGLFTQSCQVFNC